MKTNTLSTEYPFADCVEQDLLPQYIAKGLLYFVKGLAATLLAPLELLKHLQRGRGVGRVVGFSWTLSAAMYLSAVGTWILASQSHSGQAFLLCLAFFAAGVVNGRLHLRIWQAKRPIAFEYSRRVA